MLGIVIPALIVVGSIPVVLEVGYEESKFSLRGKIWFIPFPVGRERTSWVEEKAVSFLEKLPRWPFLRILLKNAYTTLCRLAPRVWFQKLRVHITASGSDPARAAMLYSGAGIVLESLSACCKDRVVKEDLRADVDFSVDSLRLLVDVSLCMRLYQSLYAAFGFALCVWRDYRRLKREYEHT